ncbi:lantibiotic dehydratase [Alkalimonas sp.]|uniref:lantibiotic dehydratase n=1 Tax=Alkalimonas sp. TaxID=1872453 RepID=UPI00263AE841|nr:lantibiotic dehydratase [Alkalimonas sp.]MCC5827232.1 lantibiotic dehydratase [Alkalimonas sp.]
MTSVANLIVLRLPRLSLKKLIELPQDNPGLQDYLESWLASPGVIEALYIASPSLLERLELWRSKPDTKSAQKVTAALLKYFVRMTSRPTPFGLFSGVTLGELSDTTGLIPCSLMEDVRKTRLDMHYLSTIQQQWAQTEQGRELLCYRPNTTLYLLGSTWHYIESYQSAAQRQYRLSSVEQDEALKVMLQLAEPGCPVSVLAARFMDTFPEAAPDDVQHYISQLIQEQILVAQLQLPITSAQPGLAFAEQLRLAGNVTESEQLISAMQQLTQLDTRGAKPEDYRDVTKQLKQLPYPVAENKLFQTDVLRAMQHCALQHDVLARIEPVLLALKAQSPDDESPFQSFITSFQQRFEGQFVPLLKVLDEEAGIPFSTDTGYETPLLAGINIAREKTNNNNKPPTALEKQLLQQLPQQEQGKFIQLQSDDLLKSLDKKSLWQELPAAFAVNLSAYRDADGQTLLYLHGCSGPSGANLLGRFCHLDATLLQKVREYLAAEEALSPDVVFAEVVHTPDGRPGNVIARPALRQYEIVFLGDSGLPAEQQISLQDLYVFVEAGHVKLWSRTLKKQVIPRLTSAHNFSARSLGVYRFLCMLQHQQNRLANFNAPASYQYLEYQPRIQLDNVIVREAQWLVERSMLEALIHQKGWNADAWHALGERYQLPRYVCYAVSDNVLTIDLHNPAMVSVLLSETLHRLKVPLKESLAMQYQSLVANDEGPFAHEILIPILNPAAKPFVTLHPDPAKQLDITIQRNFAPGSEWFSLKIYAAQSTAELVLLDDIHPLLEQCREQGLFKQWFFIRYGDPDWHLRLRLLGEPAVLYGQVLPLLQQKLASALDCGRVHRIELFTYQREVERYGGDAAMALVEQVFQVDSDFVVQTLLLSRDYGESMRWRMALLGVDTLLTAFGYELAQKLELISGLRQGFGQEFREHAQLRTQLGKKYRDFQGTLQHDFADMANDTETEPLRQMQQLCRRLQQQLEPIASHIFELQQDQSLSCSVDTILHSVLHMFNNRLFKAYGREQEFVVYDFLRRFYLSKRIFYKK